MVAMISYGPFWCREHHSRRARLEPVKVSRSVAEAIQRHSHLPHDGQIEAAQSPVVVTRIEVLERTAGLYRAAEAAGGDNGQLHVVVLPAGPHVRQPQQTAVIEDGTVAFRHLVELRREIPELADMETSDSLVAVG